jgi:hypothetical protein
VKKALVGVLAALVVIGLVLVVAALGEPDTLHVERSTAIAAAPADIFPFANDYTKWGEWDPWRAKDPDQKTEISDPPAGVGAWTTWEGDENVGKGKMTITASKENEQVVQDLHFIEPWESTAVATLTLSPQGHGTKVTWAFDSPQPFMAKAMGLFMDMDAMLGPDFEQGLSNLKTAAEKAAEARMEAEKQPEAPVEAPEGAAPGGDGD